MQTQKQLENQFGYIGGFAYHKTKDVIVSQLEKTTKIYSSQVLFVELPAGDPAFPGWLESAIEHARTRFFVWNCI